MDGKAPERGYYGNNLVCSQRCGYELALALMQAEPEIIKILPTGWNDLSKKKRQALKQRSARFKTDRKIRLRGAWQLTVDEEP